MDGWFLIGLSIGLACFGWYWLRLNIKLKGLTQRLQPELLRVPFSTPSQLIRAIAGQEALYQRAQAELMALKGLMQVAPIGFLQVDEDNQLTAFNPKACELLSLDQRSLNKPRLLLEWVRSYELDALIEETRHSQTPCQQEWVFYPVTSDYTKLTQQQPRSLRGYGFPLEYGNIAIFLESREEVTLLTQQRDRWISDVAHELKTPLTSIRLVAETLQARLTPPMQNWVERLLNETLRLSNLVQDLLDLNQLQANAQKRLTLQTVDLRCLIESVWASLEPLARQKQVEFAYHGPDGLLLQADEARLHRVLLNLLDNSLQFSPCHQTIQVNVQVLPQTTNSEPERVCLDVIDAGPGFPEHTLPYIFDRFYRGDPSRRRGIGARTSLTTNRATGASATGVSPASLGRGSAPPSTPDMPLNSSTGLGLAIVRQIVEAHQGTVTAQNHPETGGAWLQVIWPLHLTNP